MKMLAGVASQRCPGINNSDWFDFGWERCSPGTLSRSRPTPLHTHSILCVGFERLLCFVLCTFTTSEIVGENSWWAPKVWLSFWSWSEILTLQRAAMCPPSSEVRRKQHTRSYPALPLPIIANQEVGLETHSPITTNILWCSNELVDLQGLLLFSERGCVFTANRHWRSGRARTLCGEKWLFIESQRSSPKETGRNWGLDAQGQDPSGCCWWFSESKPGPHAKHYKLFTASSVLSASFSATWSGGSWKIGLLAMFWDCACN